MNPLSAKKKSVFGEVSEAVHAPELVHSGETFKKPEIGLFSEADFNYTLSIERKRTERSKKPFLLMLLNVERVLGCPESEDLLQRITSVLFFFARETDLKGWYRNGSILGVLFLEICETDARVAKEQIHTKILNGLRSGLNAEQAEAIGISLHLFPEERTGTSGFPEPDLALYPELARQNSPRRISVILKRVIDIMGSLGIIILFAPFFIGIALFIKFTSKGPILFRQQRVGQYGKRFTFLKFRSMYTNCDEKVHKEYIEKFIKEQACYTADGNGSSGCETVYKVVDDPRITPIGRFIRKTSLDELPQCFNVLKGEMSLVGPRPPIPYELDCYDVWHRRRILEMKPGITGLWQVKGRSSTNFDEMVRLDLQYTREWSPWLDIKILLLTPYVALMGKGGY